MLWREIENVLANLNCIVRCVIDDFNSVTCASKRKEINSGMVNNSEIGRFSDFIERCALKDIPVVGRKFTWYRPNGTTRSTLDKALV